MFVSILYRLWRLPELALEFSHHEGETGAFGNVQGKRHIVGQINIYPLLPPPELGSIRYHFLIP